MVTVRCSCGKLCLADDRERTIRCYHCDCRLEVPPAPDGKRRRKRKRDGGLPVWPFVAWGAGCLLAVVAIVALLRPAPKSPPPLTIKDRFQPGVGWKEVAWERWEDEGTIDVSLRHQNGLVFRLKRSDQWADFHIHIWQAKAQGPWEEEPWEEDGDYQVHRVGKGELRIERRVRTHFSSHWRDATPDERKVVLPIVLNLLADMDRALKP